VACVCTCEQTLWWPVCIHVSRRYGDLCLYVWADVMVACVLLRMRNGVNCLTAATPSCLVRHSSVRRFHLRRPTCHSESGRTSPPSWTMLALARTGPQNTVLM